jgi:hypothetical protein
MKTILTSSLVGLSLMLGMGASSAQSLTVASIFDGDRQALEHNCAEAKARYAAGAAEIFTQCGVNNR